MSKSTAAIFIDFEQVYDSVWREGLMVKLSRGGVRGNMWNWINAFLNHREARCIVNDHTGVWFQTSIGLPQGSVISPILFNIFIKDIFNNITADHCKFADDATIWHTGKQKVNGIQSTRRSESNKNMEQSMENETQQGENRILHFFLEIRKIKKSSI